MTTEVITRILKCDRCKKEVEHFEISFNVNFPVKDMLGDIAARKSMNIDLCDKCADKLKKFLDNKEPYNEKD